LKTTKFIIFFCFILSSNVFCEGAKIENGILDLRNFDWEKNPIITLDGKWDFYWNSFIEPESFVKEICRPPDNQIKVPEIWNDYKDKNNKKYGGFGYGTYHITILLGNNAPSLSFKLCDEATAYDFYVNEKKMFSNGRVGTSKENMIPQYYTGITEKLANDYKIQVTIHVSNFYHRKGGLWESIYIGKTLNILRYNENVLSYQYFLIGIFAILFLYHLTYFLLNRKRHYFLIMSFVALSVIMRLIVIDERPLTLLFPNISWVLVFKAEYLGLYLTFLMSLLFFNSIFFVSQLQPIIKALIFIKVSLCIFVIASSPYLVSFSILPFMAIAYFTMFLGYIMIIKNFKNKKIDSIMFFISLTILFLFFSIDSINNGVVETYSSLLNISFFGLCCLVIFLPMSVIIARTYSNVNKRLELLNSGLEEEVEKRTLELKRINENKTLFFANITHELKTPLTLMKNYLAKYINKKNIIDEDLLIVKNNIDRLIFDTANFLDMAKMESGTISYNHNQVINISKILSDKIPFFIPLVENKSISMEKKINDNLFIKADPIAIDKVINNLLDNAIKYTDQNGRIDILLSDNESGKIELIVKDNGDGIEEEYFGHIFSPYYQTKSNKYAYQGIGIGLFITKSIINSLNAEIFVESKINEGSEFKVVFEKQDSDEISDKAGINQSENDINISSRKIVLEEKKIDASKDNILLVEDNVEMLAYLQSVFSEKYNVYLAANGREAIDKLKVVKKIDLIVSDILMPVLNGSDFVKLIKSDHQYSDIPVIFLTAKTAENEKLDGLLSGAHDYIYKPFNIDELIYKIDNIIKGKNKAVERNKKNMRRKIESILNDINIDENEIENENIEHDRFKDFDIIKNKYNITGSENEIIKMILDGKINKEIAFELKKSVRTVEGHIRNIYLKLGISNRMELIKFISDKSKKR
jgi:signal transduction histidine kinase/DNA-binding NarL/FixJ family response regulator